jgi:hypothetical protein
MSEREEFEKWMRFSFPPSRNGDVYTGGLVQGLWEVWQAARAPLLERITALENKCALLAASWKKAEDRVAELEGTVRKMADPGHEFICAKCLLRQDGPKEDPCF